MKLKTTGCLFLATLIASFAPVAHAQTYSVIHSFNRADGSAPYGGVTIRGGKLYGTTLFGGINVGVVYEIQHSNNIWVGNTIWIFSNDFQLPYARVLFGPDGHLYGTAGQGGSSGWGSVFELTPPTTTCKTAKCTWTGISLHDFADNPSDGANPGSELTWDQQGNMYGTTALGGPGGWGTVYKMTKTGGTWNEAAIYNFSGLDGASPAAEVTLDGSGNIFGTTRTGGALDAGTVFELKYVAGVGWTHTILHDFQEGNDGWTPEAGLVSDSSGNLYGATTSAGSAGGGTLFKLSPSGDNWTFEVLYSFPGTRGCGPTETLTMDAAGNLYGTTGCSGAHSRGNIFKLANTSNGWVYSSLYDFSGASDGQGPRSNVTLDSDGTLYGTAGGGASGNGVVWMIKP